MRLYYNDTRIVNHFFTANLSFMLRKIFTLFISLALITQVFSQSISPDPNSPVCPGTTTTFTVTIPYDGTQTIQYVQGFARVITTNGVTLNTRPANVISPVANITYPSPTTLRFTFTGSFLDDNTPQSFRVEYFAGTTDTYYDFTYYKVESFANANVAYSRPVLSGPTMTVPLCQTSNIPISFTNVLFSNNDPIQVSTYGTIANYEYQMPAGWSIGTNTSTGTNWIPGINNVNITPNPATGNGQYIYVRAVNPCGSSLIKGPANQILISRPSPTLSVTSSDGSNVICSGSKTYTMNGMLPGSTIQWGLLNTSIINITGSSTSSSVIITKQSGNGAVNLQAVVTDCTGSQTVNTLVKAGTPDPLNIGISNYYNCTICDISDAKVLAGGGGRYAYNGTLQVADDGLATSFAWSNPFPGGITMYYSDLGGGTVSLGSKTSNGNITLQATANNACGSAFRYFGFVTGNCPQLFVAPGTSSTSSSVIGGAGDKLSVSQLSFFPNPAHDLLNITLPDSIDIRNAGIRILDTYGRLVKRIDEISHANNISVSGLAAGLYIVEIYTGKKLLIVQKIIKD